VGNTRSGNQIAFPKLNCNGSACSTTVNWVIQLLPSAKLYEMLCTEFCIENFKCDIDGELSHGIMSLSKIIVGNIGEQMWHLACWDCWGDYGR